MLSMRKGRASERGRTPPGLPALIGVRNLRRLGKDPLGLFMSAAELGDVVQLRFGPRTAYLLRNPEHIKLVLQERNAQYGRKTRGYEAMQLALGKGLLTSEGEFWLRQRRIMQPAFHRDRISRFAATMGNETRTLLSEWRDLTAGAAGNGKAIDVAAEMMRLTLSIVGRTLFSTDVSAETEIVGRAVTVIQEYVTERSRTLFTCPLYVPTPGNQRFRQALRDMDEIIYAKLAERRRGGADPGDLLSMLIQARDEETGERMSDRQLRDEAVTMFAAGHETTATTLTWTFYLLSKHPTVLRRLRAELDEVLKGREPTLDDLHHLPYTLMVIKESMRLYPPAWIVGRHASEQDKVDGVIIPKDSIVVISPYVTHRQPWLWENPEGFDPERFTPERSASQPRFAYFPFGGGPHLCIGSNFALLEAQLVLAMIAQRWDLHLVPGHPVELEPLVTLRPRHGMRMILLPRDQTLDPATR